VFKTFIKTLSTLFCGLTGVLLCAVLFAPTTTWASPHIVRDDTPTPPATTATVTLAMPDGSTPQGHPGTKVLITGSGFKPGSEINLYTVTDPGSCNLNNASNLASNAFTSQPVLSADGNGAFNISPTWSSNANQAGTAYYICAISTSTNTVAVSSGTFTVAQAPTINVATPTANAGDKVTITGANWTPPQQLTVNIASNASATPIASGQVPSASDGTFSINITIPVTATPGSYGVYVISADQTLKQNADNVLTVNAAATPAPTPTPTVAPSPTATPAPSPTATPAPATTTDSTKPGGPSGMTLLIFGVGGLGILLVIIGLTMYLSYSHK
jgi:hypothetical protein